MLMVLATFVMAGAAVFAQLLWTAPEMDGDGRIIGPSARDIARARRRGR